MFVLITSGLSQVIQRTKPFHKIYSNCALVTIPDSLKSPGLVSDKKNKTSSNKGKHNSNYTNIMLKKKTKNPNSDIHRSLSGTSKVSF